MHPPVCRNHTQFKWGKPNKKSKKGGAKGSFVMVKELTPMNCVSQDPQRRQIGKHSQDAVPAKHLARIKIGKERVHRWVLFRSVHLISEVLALQNLQKGHKKIPCNKNDAPAESHGTWLKIRTSSVIWTKLRSLLLLKQGECRHFFHYYPRRENSWLIQELQCTGWAKKFWAQMKRAFCNGSDSQQWSWWLMERCKHSRRHNSFSRSWIIRDCPTRWNASSLIARKNLRRPRIFLWVGWRPKATVDPKWEDNHLQNRQPRTPCCFRIVIRFRKQYIFNVAVKRSVFNRSVRRATWCRSHRSRSAFQQKTQNRNKNKERRSDADGPLQDLLEVVERSVVDRSVGTATWGESFRRRDQQSILQKPKTKIKKKNKRNADLFRARFPDWLEPFTDNLEETETPAQAQVSQNSDSERTTKRAERSRKHNIFIHFPKCRDHDICLKIKITRESPV